MNSVCQRIERRLLRSPIIRRLVDRWPRESLSSRQQTLIGVLALANEHDVSPVTMIESLAQQSGLAYRRRLRKLAQRISSGTPIPAALEQTPGAVTDETVLALQIASQTGTIRETFSAISGRRQNSENARPGLDRRRFTRNYLIASLIVLSLALLFLWVFVFPMIKEVYNEFGMRLPASMESLQQTTLHVINYWHFGVLAAIVLAACATSPWIRHWWRQSSLSGVFRNNAKLHSASILRCLAISTRSGRPVIATLSALGKYHFDGRTRQKLVLARNEIEQGQDVWKALAETRLLSGRESGGLAALDNADVRAWAMWQLANQRDDQRESRRHWTWELVHPAVVLLFGIFVAWVGFAIVQSLYSLAVGTY